MFGLIKKIFFELLSNIFNGCNHNKCDSLSNQKCIIQTTLINSHPNKYSQEFYYYPFAVKLYRCVGSYNTLNDLFNKVCGSNKTVNLNLNVFNIVIGTNESKILAGYISYECKHIFDGRIYNSYQCCNNNKCRCKY